MLLKTLSRKYLLFIIGPPLRGGRLILEYLTNPRVLDNSSGFGQIFGFWTKNLGLDNISGSLDKIFCFFNISLIIFLKIKNPYAIFGWFSFFSCKFYVFLSVEFGEKLLQDFDWYSKSFLRTYPNINT